MTSTGGAQTRVKNMDTFPTLPEPKSVCAKRKESTNRDVRFLRWRDAPLTCTRQGIKPSNAMYREVIR